MCHDETKGSGSVEFRVITNGKPLWSSGVMRGKQPAKEVDTDVSGLKTLILQVGDAGDGIDLSVTVSEGTTFSAMWGPSWNLWVSMKRSTFESPLIFSRESA